MQAKPQKQIEIEVTPPKGEATAPSEGSLSFAAAGTNSYRPDRLTVLISTFPFRDAQGWVEPRDPYLHRCTNCNSSRVHKLKIGPRAGLWRCDRCGAYMEAPKRRGER